ICVVELDTGEAHKTIGWRKRPVHDFIFLVDDAKRQVESVENRPRNFVVEIQEDLPVVDCDVQYLTIAVRELLDNAAKFSKDNDTVKLTVWAEGDDLVMTVSDTGRGIEAHEIENIWKPFYQI